MYLRHRIIPCLLLENKGLVKTIKFSKPRYIGDPINTVKIFNGKFVDELCILDIKASVENREPDFDLLKEIASEAFMPLSYGGGINSLEQIKKLLFIGYEKVIINSAFVRNPDLVKEAIEFAGSQSVVISLDYKKDFKGKKYCYILSGKKKVKFSPFLLARKAQEMGVGEIILNSIDKDGTMEGYDYDQVKEITDNLSIPLIACGGAGTLKDMKKVIKESGAHAAAAGSYFIYYGKQKAVLITYPKEEALSELGIY